ncbi:MAG TPA: sodium:solute symporter family protein [Gemmatimonadaceae bacterium]|nr:sodium:solute symporter family protein [Gemmatimonadaceae bacterium]
MTQAQLTTFYVAVGIYIAIVCGIGLRAYRKTKSEEGFLVAGRSLGPIVGGATLMANQVSAGATIGMVGFHYFSGISYAWSWPIVWVGWVVCALFVAPKVRRLKGVTLPDYFATRFDSNAARAVSAVFILIAYTVMLSAQYQAGGLLFTLVGGLSYTKAVLLVAGITTMYTFLGGMYSNAYVGVLKAAMLIGCYVIAVPFLIKHVGGIDTIGNALHSLDPRLTGNWFGVRQILAISLAIGLGLAAAPYEISAIYAMQSRKTVRQAIGYSFLFQAIIGIGILLFGLSMRVAVPHLPDPDLATPMLGMSILPFWIGLLVLLAAVVTFTRTGGAILLTVASAMSHDLYAKLIAPNASETAKVAAGRIGVVVFSVIPVALALRQLSLVNWIVIYAAKILVSFLFVPVVIGLNWKRATRAGALAAMIGGLVTCLVWLAQRRPYVLGLDAAEAGVLVSAALFFGVSMITKPVSNTSLEIFFPNHKTGVGG